MTRVCMVRVSRRNVSFCWWTQPNCHVISNVLLKLWEWANWPEAASQLFAIKVDLFYLFHRRLHSSGWLILLVCDNLSAAISTEFIPADFVNVWQVLCAHYCDNMLLIVLMRQFKVIILMSLTSWLCRALYRNWASPATARPVLISCHVLFWGHFCFNYPCHSTRLTRCWLVWSALTVLARVYRCGTFQKGQIRLVSLSAD